MKPNIVLLAIDSLRADHLSCYGYSRPTSPHIDAFARSGALCESFFPPALPTHPSFTSLYTGQHPIRHGIVSHGGAAKLASDTPVLPQVLMKAGYTTCALDNLMRERLWFGKGYEYYIDPGQKRILSLCVTAEDLNHRAIPWIREHRDEPFFLFMHYWDPHAPYAPPPRYQSLFYDGDPYAADNHSLDAFWPTPLGRLARDTWLSTPEGVITDAAYVEALYDREIRHVDDGIGELVDAIDQLGLAENTLIVVVGDHGESMTEHGIFFDHHGLYEPTLRIPFIARWPGRIGSGERLPQLLQNHDVAPTLLQAAGVPVPRTMDGQSFWPLLTGETTTGGRDDVISLECTLQAKWCLRTREHKFILARQPDIYGSPLRELYDLRNDPRELHNLADEAPDVVREMEDRLEAWIAARLRKLGKTRDPLIEQGISLRGIIEEWTSGNPAARERLAATGAGAGDGRIGVAG